MRLPEALTNLLNDGIIEDVIRPLQSGKEAQVFLVKSQGEVRVAKVYKSSKNRSFRNRSEYVEGRRIRNSRQQRAMDKGSGYGKSKIESEWHRAEVDMLRLLGESGVRVPQCYDFVENVLIMELIKDNKGLPAPRMVDLNFSAQQAEELMQGLLKDVILMLCAGVVHCDLSDFNILISERGPVIIDFPQAIYTSNNRNARKMLIRDVRNLSHFLGRFSRRLRRLKYGQEMWALYEQGDLDKDTVLTGRYKPKDIKVDDEALLRQIQAEAREAANLQSKIGISKYAARKARRAQEIADAIEEQEKKEKAEAAASSKSKPSGQNKRKHRSRRNRRRRKKQSSG
jgi:RIO kinase 1